MRAESVPRQDRFSSTTGAFRLYDPQLTQVCAVDPGLGNAVGGSVAQIGGARAALLLSAAVSVCAVVLSVLGCARLDRALSYEN